MRRGFFTMLILVISCHISTGGEFDNEQGVRKGFVSFLQEYLTIKYSGRDFQEYLYVSIKKQKLYHISDQLIIAEYPVSTSRHGPGSEHDSEKTPTGLHSIRSKFGDAVPLGGILKFRQFSGEVAEIISDPVTTKSDDVTTRILWLDGEEPGINKGGNLDSYNRCIYIHGTPEEGLIGTPSSHGCIRMKNSDVLQLFHAVSEKMHVIILNN